MTLRTTCPPIACAIAIACFTACGIFGTEADTDTDVDSETDIDTEAEVDTEADTEADTEPDTEREVTLANLPNGASRLSGTMNYTSTSVGFTDTNPDIDTSCTAQFAVTGTEFTGDCNDCEWAFELDLTENSSDCDVIDPALALLEPALDGTVVLVYWPAYYGTNATYSDVLAAGSVFDYNGRTYAIFDQLINLDYYGTIYGAETLNFSDEGLDWSIIDTEEMLITEYSAPSCEESELDYNLDPMGRPSTGTTTATGTLRCAGQGSRDSLVFDTYTFTATTGDNIEISVDTVADATAFDSWVQIMSPSGCTVAQADDTFECSFEPADYQCAGLRFTAAETGEYLVIVGSYGSCNGFATSGSYIVNTTASALDADQDNVGFDDATVTTDLTTTVNIDADLTFGP